MIDYEGRWENNHRQAAWCYWRSPAHKHIILSLFSSGIFGRIQKYLTKLTKMWHTLPDFILFARTLFGTALIRQSSRVPNKNMRQFGVAHDI